MKTAIDIEPAFVLTFGAERLTLSREDLLKLRARIDAFLRDSIHPEIVIIQETVAEEFEISPFEMLSTSKKDRAAWPRQVAMVFCHELLPGQSQTAIAKAFYRDHGTVTHNLKAVRDRLSVDPKMTLRVNALRVILREKLAALAVSAVKIEAAV